MKKHFAVIVFLLLSFTNLKGGYEISKAEMINYSDSLNALFYSRYAPADWKQEYCQWDLNQEIARFKNSIENEGTATIKDFHRQLGKFIRSMKDYHVNAYFYCTESACLPFKAKRFGDRYFLTYVDEGKFAFFHAGDELVEFDGRHPDDAVQELMLLASHSATPETDQCLAEINLTARSACIGNKVPKGPVTVSVRDKDTKELKTYQMIWTYRPEEVQDFVVAKPQNHLLPKWLDKDRMKCDRALPLAQNYLSFCCGEEETLTLDPNEIGAKRSFLPTLGSVCWETNSSNSIHAYLYINEEKKTVGYLRIPHYMLDLEELQEIEEILQIMNENADALVIDQLNNPGGNLFVVYAIASMLTDKPLVTPKEHILLSQEEVMEAGNDD